MRIIRIDLNRHIIKEESFEQSQYGFFGGESHRAFSELP